MEYPLPAFVRVTLLTIPLDNVAVAFAFAPFPPVIVTGGAVKYPEPGLDTVIATTVPLCMVAYATAVAPPDTWGAPIVTVGTAVYPVPTLPTTTLCTPPAPVVIDATAVAWTPLALLGAEIVTVGAAV